MSLRDLIRRAASRNIGMLTSDIAEFTVHQVGLACYKMAAKGELHRVKCGKRAVRYFTDPAKADALRERIRIAEQERLAVGIATAGTPAPAWPPGTEAVITEKTVFTQCPSFTPPFVGLCGNAAHIHGGNQRGRVIPTHLVLERMRAAP